MPFPRHVHLTLRSSPLSLSPPLTTTLKPPTPISYTLRNHTTRGPRTHERPPSSAQPVSPSIPSVSSTSTATLTDTVNPPPSTLPADLALPDQLNPSAPTTQKLKRLITVGRAYLSFYKTGLKNVYHNYRASIPFRRELGLSVYLPTSPSPLSVRVSSPSKTNTLQLSRSNFQLLHRSSHDLRRLIPFSITLVICGELTPILVLLLGNAITPTTCRIPRQITKSRVQRSKLKKDALVAEAVARNGSLVPVAPGSDEELDVLGRFVELGLVRDGDGNGIARACAVFGLAKRVDLKGPLAWVMASVYRRRLRGYVEYLGLDDELIREGGGVTRMEGKEVRIAVEERGGDIGRGDGKDEWEEEREERRWLERWLQRRLG